ncbi:DNA repair protein RecO [Peptococcaceae bacterium]|nr:DNA repair protein RecO [Peptococcaceae bacterium]
MLYKAEAVVLRYKNMRDADKVAVLFSRELGKIRTAAHGVVKAKSKKRGAVQPFTHSAFLLRKGRELDSISQCEAITFFLNLRNELKRLTSALYVCELTDELTAEKEPNEPLFILLLTTLKWLNSNVVNGVGLDKITAGFEIKALGLCGYMPQLTRCVNCGERAKLPLKFSYKMGGILCTECNNADESALTISERELLTMKELITTAPGKLKDIDVSNESLKQIKRILNLFTVHHLDKKIKSN